MHKTESGTLLKVRLVGTVLVIRQVNLGGEAANAIRGGQVNLSPSTRKRVG